MQPWWIDVILVVVALLYMVDGVRRGFLLVALEVVGFFLSLVIALIAYTQAAKIVLHFFAIPRSFANAIAFFLLWIGIGLVYPYLARYIYKHIKTELTAHQWNHYLGFIPAFLDAFILAAVILPLLVALPLPSNVKGAVLNSQIGAPIARFAAKMDQGVEAVFSPAVRDSLSFLTIHPKSDESVALGFQTTNYKIDETSETELFKLVNEERAKLGLKILVYDQKLRDVGRLHAEDMVKRGYFSHLTPEGNTPADRAKVFGIMYLVLGENLAFAPDVSYAHDGLMNSPGHRANILSTEFGKLGIGVIDAGIYGKMFVQTFSD